MNKLIASIVKELQLLFFDKIGLLLLYLMPIVLVFIITIVQDSAFRLVNDNQLEIIITNRDRGNLGDSLVEILEKSGNFAIEKHYTLDETQLQELGLKKGRLASIYIPENFSQAIHANTGSLTGLILKEFGMADSFEDAGHQRTNLVIYFDPVLQDNYKQTLITSMHTILSGMENKVLLDHLFEEMGYDEIPPHIAKRMSGEKTPVVAKLASLQSKQKLTPNSTQHNVPAWSIFAMFFMVVTLGGNLVKERLSGSFVRLLTIPPSFTYTIASKMIVYLAVAISQLFILFSIGHFLFPLIDLPQLQIPDAWAQLFVISFLSGLAAVSYAILIGTYASTFEQANGFGAVSIVIFAAIGGIWVPTFIMPDYMQNIALLSPLYWCLEGYYTLFLKNGDWNALRSSIIFLSLFIVVCQILTLTKLKLQNYL